MNLLSDYIERRLHAPHFFEAVKRADFGAEQVNDNVSCVHYDPVCLGQALDPDLLLSRLFQLFSQLLCQSMNVPGGCARSDDHIIGDGRCVFEGDCDDVLCLVRIQRFLDEGFQFFGG